MDSPFTQAMTAATYVTLYLTFVPYEIHMISKILHAKDMARSALEKSPQEGVYDFIIVGGGACGSILANRLSKIKKYRVLLLERGGDPNYLTSVPYLYQEYTKSPETAHVYHSVKQDRSFRSTEGVITIPQGIGLGGSTEINDMQYLRGSPSVYDEWAKITDDPRWSYSRVLPFFKKFENFQGDGKVPASNTKYRSVDGEMHVEYQSFHPSRSYLFKALEENGYQRKDLNAGGPADKEYDPIQMDTKRGKRQGGFESFLEPVIERRRNLRIVRYATVTKIHLDSENHAYGVTYFKNGRRYFVRTRKEIIVSAGAFESPKLLMLSGIGPRKHLEDIGIPCKMDLPVGKRLLDHTGVTIKALFNESVSFLPSRDLTFNSITDYYKDGTGPLRSPDGFFAMIYRISNRNKKAGLKTPDIQIIVGCGNIQPGRNSSRGTTTTEDNNGIYIYNYRPTSFGKLKLSSKSPWEDPLIDQQFYSDPSDLKVVVDGINYMIELYETTETYRRLNARIIPDNQNPTCNKFEFRSQKYWECYIMDSTNYGIHPCGACSMGSGNDDPYAVVDSELRVLNTGGLRVVDSSVIPRIPNVNLMVPTLMIGERGADLIRRTWSKRVKSSRLRKQRIRKSKNHNTTFT